MEARRYLRILWSRGDVHFEKEFFCHLLENAEREKMDTEMFYLLDGEKENEWKSHFSIVTPFPHLLTLLCNTFSKAFKIKHVALKKGV